MGVAGRRQDRSLLKRVGVPALWQKAMPTTGLTGLGELALDEQEESGFVYDEARPVHVLFTNDDRSQDYDPVGAWSRGECFGTIAAHIPVGFGDRLILQREVRGSLLVRKDSSHVVVLKTPWIQRILSVQSNLTQYTQGTDYKLVQKSEGVCELHWLEAGRTPPVGDFYALSLMQWPVWIVGAEPRLRSLGRLKRDQLPWKLKLVRDNPEARGG